MGDETERVAIALHKPAGYITTRTDPGGRLTVYELLHDLDRWVFPVGRLDRDTSGLLILTNDHRLGHRLTDPGHHVPKTYHARVRGVPGAEALRALAEGVPLGDGSDRRGRRSSVRWDGARRRLLAGDRPHRGEEPPGAPDVRGGRATTCSSWCASPSARSPSATSPPASGAPRRRPSSPR